MVQWLSGKVVKRIMWTDRLFSLCVDGEIAPFEAGQFLKLGLQVGDEIIGRPYSLVNSPAERPLEFCFSVVPGGPLSERLAKLNSGDPVLVAPRAHGFLVLKEINAGTDLWLIATGTGIGPFLSILKTAEPWQRFERIILVHATRLAAELMYRDTIEKFTLEHAENFVYIPFVSQEHTSFALKGRIPLAITDGRLEARAATQFSAANSQVILCGNPNMVSEVQQLLISRGLKKNRRTDPGNITIENYW